MPLLESNIPQIPSKETSIILHHVESDLMPLIERKKNKVRENPDSPVDLIKDYRIENIDEIVKLLRLACARNISRAFIIENTQKNLVAC
uniref:Uncharacterized protein n=1 Tax=Megaselia scalaris TaxID=36166 RepID=T1GZG6_MEGSC